jgi:septum formation protein
MHDKTAEWKLVLASQSPRRRELLARAGAPFVVLTSSGEEYSASTDPRTFALEIARRKGEEVRAGLTAERHVVVSADTVVAVGNRILGKPRDADEAREFLQLMATRRHEVHTAVVLHIGERGAWREVAHVETTRVVFGELSPYLLERYVASADPLDKAGAYGIQGDALAFVTGIEGCYGNVMGFPLARFCAMMDAEEAWGTPWQRYFF